MASEAKLSMPIVEELAADIFMGRFSGKFVESAKIAVELLEGTLYATYYDLDGAVIRAIPVPQKPKPQKKGPFSPRAYVPPPPDPLAELCAARAGVSLGTWKPAINGMIVEQQQILTTQNLAALYTGLNLTKALQPHLQQMAMTCFEWICRRLQVKARHHAQLIAVKNSTYAWRQMIFYLSLLPADDVASFLTWAETHLASQPQAFRDRFGPAP
jgi:hypothetical protein